MELVKNYRFFVTHCLSSLNFLPSSLSLHLSSSSKLNSFNSRVVDRELYPLLLYFQVVLQDKCLETPIFKHLGIHLLIIVMGFFQLEI